MHGCQERVIIKDVISLDLLAISVMSQEVNELKNVFSLP